MICYNSNVHDFSDMHSCGFLGTQLSVIFFYVFVESALDTISFLV